ncbi:nitronate monooxygenase [Mycolicibacterium lutetiense]|jgi:nitronate monooxygenase|uniref:Propionate 3-nitronate monooxygenase n=1 Tax=Mycolicibacterium lutetiense TaxID=1641992 RepID=A0ABS4ZQF8_9MYCO|nr:nitronate monooxygenase [Mycolicibacterium lutetiense]MBP2450864.1 nitronate monooxygenase [Mycolicibacterium lutetiense]
MGTFDIRGLRRPVIVAPMAGGPSTPELAAAGSNAGGLGFLAAGYLTAEALAERVTAARGLTAEPLGVNLFAPQPSAGTADQIHAYAAELAGEAQRYGVALGEPRYDDDAWAAKLDAVFDLRPEVVSFTFGLPSEPEIARLRSVGISTVGTVTTLDEAWLAVGRGVDALAVQGPAAGGHRGTFDPGASPASQSLDHLLADVLAAVDIPVVAAGGLVSADDIAGVLAAGAVAAQLGTAFLLADESGSSPVHRAALQSLDFTETVVTRAFSGRYARGLRNRFISEHDGQAPLGYPEIHYLTSPVRKASVAAGDPQATNVWAGTGWRQARPGSVAEIIDRVSPAR